VHAACMKGLSKGKNLEKLDLLGLSVSVFTESAGITGLRRKLSFNYFFLLGMNREGETSRARKKIREEIAKETSRDWKGLRVTVKISLKNCQAKFIIVPSATALVIKAQKERERDKEKMKIIKHTGNILVDDVIEIAK
ncbi:hypothetical protein KI387_021150, partial [Taxus chinensis]